MERWTPTGGTPQGAVISPLLVNIYLHPLDQQMKQQGYRMVRYADDFVVFCRSAEQAQAAHEEVKTWVEENGLILNADKTHVGDCRQAGQGFEFLGYRFEAGRRWVRPKSFKALRERDHGMKTKREHVETAWQRSSRILIPCCAVGLTTSSMLIRWYMIADRRFDPSQATRASFASRRSNRGWGDVLMIILGGPILTSQHKGCSP